MNLYEHRIGLVFLLSSNSTADVCCSLQDGSSQLLGAAVFLQRRVPSVAVNGICFPARFVRLAYTKATTLVRWLLKYLKLPTPPQHKYRHLKTKSQS